MSRIKQLIPRLDFNGDEDEGQFAGCWELELLRGESTDRHEHKEREEVCYVLLGAGAMLIGKKEGPIEKGDVVHIPPATTHQIENDSSKRLRCLLVGTEVPMGPEEAAVEKRTLAHLEQVIRAIPSNVGEAEAIQGIVALFDIGGALSEQIETAFGLDNPDGLEALSKIEQRIMRAVVEITRRYSLGMRGFHTI